MADLIQPDGTVTEVKPKNGKEFTLEELQAHVGGYIEMLDVGDGRKLIVDEEGKLKRLAPNYAATMLYRRDVLVGTVLVIKRNEIR